MFPTETHENRRNVHLRTYTTHGFSFLSEIELPELTTSESDTTRDGRICDRGGVEMVPSIYGFESNPDGFSIWWDLVGRFLISRHGDVAFQRMVGVSDDLLRLPLASCILAIAAQIKGRFMLHANAVNICGRGVLLIGEKGAGKSTLTAALLSRGHMLLSDDAAALTIMSDNSVMVYRGCLQLKLWPDSVAKYAEATAGNHRAMHDHCEKRIVWANEYASTLDKVPVSRIYLLANGSKLLTRRLTAAESWRKIYAHTYAALFRESFLEPHSRGEHFFQCTSLARIVGVTLLERTKTFEETDDVVAAIEKDIGCGPPQKRTD